MRSGVHQKGAAEIRLKNPHSVSGAQFNLRVCLLPSKKHPKRVDTANIDIIYIYIYEK